MWFADCVKVQFLDALVNAVYFDSSNFACKRQAVERVVVLFDGGVQRHDQQNTASLVDQTVFQNSSEFAVSVRNVVGNLGWLQQIPQIGKLGRQLGLHLELDKPSNAVSQSEK